MQFIVFRLGKDCYGLNTQRVLRVLPLMELKRIPQAPGHVAGLMNLHGEAIPVLDLCMLACGTPCAPHFDTRILLVDYRAPDGGAHMLGMIVERVAGMRRLDPGAFSESGVPMRHTPFLGKVAAETGGIIQLVEVEHLLTEDVRALLFSNHAQAAP